MTSGCRAEACPCLPVVRLEALGLLSQGVGVEAERAQPLNVVESPGNRDAMAAPRELEQRRDQRVQAAGGQRGSMPKQTTTRGTARTALEELTDSGRLPALAGDVEHELETARRRVNSGELLELPGMGLPADQPTRELTSGARMPVLGLGVWQLAGGGETERAVEWALEAGYRHIDTASMYRNEQSVGAALKRSGLSREQVFVTTKLMPIHASAARELAKSLKRLKLDYVDLYLIHWPTPLLRRRYWQQLISLQERGLTREIGVSNYSRSQLEELRRRGLKIPAVNQVHFSPFHHSRPLLEYCDAHGIVLEAYSPLERGRGVHDPTIVRLAEQLGRTPAQIMLRWAIQQQTVVIPKSSHQDRIRSNAQLFDFQLSDADMQILDQLDRGQD
jgi:diketogulonate reductase-like aldo/keto reductase